VRVVYLLGRVRSEDKGEALNECEHLRTGSRLAALSLQSPNTLLSPLRAHLVNL